MNNIGKYAKGLLTNAQKYLKQSLDEANGEALHKLRVEIKKIDALQQFLTYCYQYDFGENRKLKKLYRRAGKIRDLQLLIQHLEKQIKANTAHEQKLLRKLKQQLSDRSKLFKQRYQKNYTEAFEKIISSIHNCLSSKLKNEPDTYFGMMKGKIIVSVIRINRKEKQIHTLRRDIKTLRYNLKISQKIKTENLMDEMLLTKWDGLLGEWHDAFQLATRIDKIKTKLKPEAELHNKLMNIRKDYMSRSKTLIKEFKRTTVI